VNARRPLPSRQRGAALFISLMVLLLITVLALSAANMGIMQERMAGNVRESNEAFQAAEATLREIERRLAAIARGGTGGIPVPPRWGSMALDDNDCTLSSPNGWSGWDAAPWQTAPTTGGRYIVIDLDKYVDGAGLPRAVSCQLMNSDDPARAGQNYLIVARASGPAGTGDVILQSIFFWPE
jgi:type IV pilus assembly protein PilX